MIVMDSRTRIWHEAFKHISARTFRLKIDNASGTGFYLANAILADGSYYITIATAYHVLNEAKSEDTLRIWGESNFYDIPFKIWQKELILSPELDLAFFSVPSKYLAGIPNSPLDIYHGLLPIASEIAWCGYPSICIGKLCYFHGYISTTIENDYLIDGVAINGVSGGPAFILSELDVPLVCGLVTEYRPNVINKTTYLPGLTYLRSISPIFQYLIEYNKDSGFNGAVIHDYREVDVDNTN